MTCQTSIFLQEFLQFFWLVEFPEVQYKDQQYYEHSHPSNDK